jgi:hypothetical protein
MTDLFITDKLKSFLPRIQAFMKEEVVPVEKIAQHKPFIHLGRKQKKKTCGRHISLKMRAVWVCRLPSLGR